MANKKKPDVEISKIPTRKIQSFEPCGPILAMITLEVRGKKFGAKTRMMEDAIAERCRKKYPKLYERFLFLRAEAGGEVPSENGVMA